LELAFRTFSTLSWTISSSRRVKPVLMAASISSVVGGERDGSAREALYVLFNSRATKLIRTCRNLADVVQPLLMISDSL